MLLGHKYSDVIKSFFLHSYIFNFCRFLELQTPVTYVEAKTACGQQSGHPFHFEAIFHLAVFESEDEWQEVVQELLRARGESAKI